MLCCLSLLLPLAKACVSPNNVKQLVTIWSTNFPGITLPQSWKKWCCHIATIMEEMVLSVQDTSGCLHNISESTKASTVK